MGKYFSNEQGATLIVVLLVMVVSMILMTSLLSLSFSDTVMAVNQEKNLQAEYIAKAGADIVAYDIITTPGAYSSGKEISDTVVGEGSFSAEVWMDGNDYIIESTGVVDENSQTVKLAIGKSSYNDIFKGIRQTGYGDLDLRNVDITSQNNVDVTLEANVNSLGQIKYNESEDFEINSKINKNNIGEIDFPSDISSTDDEISGDNEISGDKYYTKIKLNNGTITFDNEGNEQRIVVDDLIFKSTVNITGGGSTHIFIKNDGTIQTPINVNDDGSLLFIYVANEKNLDLRANANSTIYVYGPNAKIILQSNSSINGAIIGNSIKRNSNISPKGNFKYVPLPDDYSGGFISNFEKKYYSN